MVEAIYRLVACHVFPSGQPGQSNPVQFNTMQLSPNQTDVLLCVFVCVQQTVLTPGSSGQSQEGELSARPD